MDIDAQLIALVGGTVLAALLVGAVAKRLGFPALVGHLLLGTALRGLDVRFEFLADDAYAAFHILANLGIVALLFEVGLKSHPEALAAKLPQAFAIWTGDVVISCVLMYVACRYAVGLPLLPSLVVATALSGTSVGVCAGIWGTAGRLDTSDGELLIDVAELDDISAVGLMAVLFALAPVLASGNGGLFVPLVDATLQFVLALALLLALCFVFARFAEHRVMRIADTLPHAPERMLVVAGLGFLIAAFAAWLGFSLAIGALLAGLVFSRDPDAVRTERSFRVLSAFVTPFFFVFIGLNVDPSSLSGALGLSAVLLAAALAGKFLGAFLPALMSTTTLGAVLLGVSMIPRAEITMVVMDQARSRFPELVSAELYSAAVVVTAVTCLLAPLLLAPLFRRADRR